METKIALMCFVRDGVVFVPPTYVEAIRKAGAIPMLIPPDIKLAREAFEYSDGVVFVGGGDINAKIYGENTKNDHNVDDERDKYELLSYRIAREKGLSVLGICRGCQLINVAHGGKLIPHIDGHEDCEHWITASHGSPLYKTFGRRIHTNSFHHQACGELGRGIGVDAVAEDGVIEAVSTWDGKVWGVQFHPERDEGLLALFDASIDNCHRKW